MAKQAQTGLRGDQMERGVGERERPLFSMKSPILKSSIYY